jgi:hypothetical protein
MALALLLILSRPGAGHPLHESLAEVEWVAWRGHFEIALGVVPEDLEEALLEATSRRVRLEDEEAEPLLAAYLEARFRVESGSGESSVVRFVGREVSHKRAWLYFELTPPPGAAGPWVLVDEVLLDVVPDQVNHVQLRSGMDRVALRFTAQERRQELPGGFAPDGLGPGWPDEPWVARAERIVRVAGLALPTLIILWLLG